MIPLYYMDDTVRRRAEFAEKAMAVVIHTPLVKRWRLYQSFLDGVTLPGGRKARKPDSTSVVSWWS